MEEEKQGDEHQLALSMLCVLSEKQTGLISFNSSQPPSTEVARAWLITRPIRFGVLWIGVGRLRLSVPRIFECNVNQPQPATVQPRAKCHRSTSHRREDAAGKTRTGPTQTRRSKEFRKAWGRVTSVSATTEVSPSALFQRQRRRGETSTESQEAITPIHYHPDTFAPRSTQHTSSRTPKRSSPRGSSSTSRQRPTGHSGLRSGLSPFHSHPLYSTLPFFFLPSSRLSPAPVKNPHATSACKSSSAHSPPPPPPSQPPLASSPPLALSVGSLSIAGLAALIA